MSNEPGFPPQEGWDTGQRSGVAPPAWSPQPPPNAGYLQPLAQGGFPVPVPAQTNGNGLAAASLVLGITSIVFCWWGLFTLAQVVLATVFAVKGINRANMGAGGKGLAVAGLVCGCIGAVGYLIFGIFTVGIGFFI